MRSNFLAVSGGPYFYYSFLAFFFSGISLVTLSALKAIALFFKKQENRSDPRSSPRPVKRTNFRPARMDYYKNCDGAGRKTGLKARAKNN